MTTTPDYVDILREYNRLIVHIVNATRGTKKANNEYRRASALLLQSLLGRAPTAEEIAQVCDW